MRAQSLRPLRSNTAAGKKLLLERVTTFVKHLSGKVVTMSDYPAWEYKSDSQLRKICVDSFTNVYGHEPEVTSIHAGLECGILAGKMPGRNRSGFKGNIGNFRFAKNWEGVIGE